MNWGVVLKFSELYVIRPLTLNQIRSLHSEHPVYIKRLGETNIYQDGWCHIIFCKDKQDRAFIVWPGIEIEDTVMLHDYGETWIVYTYVCLCVDKSAWRCGMCEVPTHWEEWGKSGYNYCPYCGRPLTDAAWEYLERRFSD